MELRYMGFDQRRNARAFRFDVVVKGEATKQAVVTADLALFLEHHVGIQDGPALCATKLGADLANQIEGEHVLTSDDLRAFSASKAAAEAKRIEARQLAGRRHSPANPTFTNPQGRW